MSTPGSMNSNDGKPLGPMKRVLRFLGIIALGVLALGVVGALVIYSGAYDVSATSGHTPMVERALHTLMERSVRAHARDVVSPVGTDFRAPKVLELATAHYEGMCRTCHAAPGKRADPWLLYPPAPDLTQATHQQHWSDAEIFWIIKHGIKDTAMGAFGGTHPGAHSDQDIWGMTALIRQLPSLTAAQYTAMTELGRIQQNSQGGGHHAGGQPPPKQDAPKAAEPHKH